MRSALLLTLGAGAVVLALRFAHLGGRLGMWADMLSTLVCFGGGAYLGLCVLDGDHRKIVPLRALSRAQILWLSLLGVLAVAPMTLAHDLTGKLVSISHETALSAPQRPVAFLQTVVKSALIAPICEELFFRGYLLHALERFGRMRAAVVTALCFALVHPLEGFAPLALLGLLLCWMTKRTHSLLAPVLVHMSYNMTIILISHLGLSALFSGWSFVSCALRLVLCAAFAAVLRRAYTARAEMASFTLWEGGALTRREMALLIGTVLLFAATLMTRRLVGL